jgi:hypothetical protein
MKKKALSNAELVAMAKEGNAHTILPSSQTPSMGRTAQSQPIGSAAVGTPRTPYTGFSDPSLDSEGAAISDNITSFNRERIYTMGIENPSAKDAIVILCPGLKYIKNPIGLILQGEFRGKGDVASSTDVLMGAGSPGSLDDLHAWHYKNPTLCSMMMIKSDNIMQFTKEIYVEEQRPHNVNNKISNIPLAPLSNEYVEQQNVVTLRTPVVFDDQTEISIVIPAQTKTSISLFFGASQNLTGLYKKKLAEAMRQAEAQR